MFNRGCLSSSFARSRSLLCLFARPLPLQRVGRVCCIVRFPCLPASSLRLPVAFPSPVHSGFAVAFFCLSPMMSHHHPALSFPSLLKRELVQRRYPSSAPCRVTSRQRPRASRLCALLHSARQSAMAAFEQIPQTNSSLKNHGCRSCHCYRFPPYAPLPTIKYAQAPSKIRCLKMADPRRTNKATKANADSLTLGQTGGLAPSQPRLPRHSARRRRQRRRPPPSGTAQSLRGPGLGALRMKYEGLR